MRLSLWNWTGWGQGLGLESSLVTEAAVLRRGVLLKDFSTVLGRGLWLGHGVGREAVARSWILQSLWRLRGDKHKEGPPPPSSGLENVLMTSPGHCPSVAGTCFAPGPC